MKNVLVLLSVMSSFLLSGTAAYAQNAVQLRVEVPFSFIVNNTELPAGGYVVEYTPSPMTGAFSPVSVLDRNGDRAAFLFVRQLSEGDATKGCLQFTRYGSTYFLSAVLHDGSRGVVNTSQAERGILAQYKAQVATVAAVN